MNGSDVFRALDGGYLRMLANLDLRICHHPIAEIRGHALAQVTASHYQLWDQAVWGAGMFSLSRTKIPRVYRKDQSALFEIIRISHWTSRKSRWPRVN
jgi:hypothetical protein